MNLTTLLRIAGAAAAITGAGLATHDYCKTVRIERQKREEIESEKKKQILAILKAELTVQQKILRGDYDHGLGTLASVPEILTDLKFYQIAAREK